MAWTVGSGAWTPYQPDLAEQKRAMVALHSRRAMVVDGASSRPAPSPAPFDEG